MDDQKPSGASTSAKTYLKYLFMFAAGLVTQAKLPGLLSWTNDKLIPVPAKMVEITTATVVNNQGQLLGAETIVSNSGNGADLASIGGLNVYATGALNPSNNPTLWQKALDHPQLAFDAKQAVLNLTQGVNPGSPINTSISPVAGATTFIQNAFYSVAPDGAYKLYGSFRYVNGQLMEHAGPSFSTLATDAVGHASYLFPVAAAAIVGGVAVAAYAFKKRPGYLNSLRQKLHR